MCADGRRVGRRHHHPEAVPRDGDLPQRPRDPRGGRQPDRRCAGVCARGDFESAIRNRAGGGRARRGAGRLLLVARARSEGDRQHAAEVADRCHRGSRGTRREFIGFNRAACSKRPSMRPVHMRRGPHRRRTGASAGHRRQDRRPAPRAMGADGAHPRDTVARSPHERRGLRPAPGACTSASSIPWFAWTLVRRDRRRRPAPTLLISASAADAHVSGEDAARAGGSRIPGASPCRRRSA